MLIINNNFDNPFFFNNPNLLGWNVECFPSTFPGNDFVAAKKNPCFFLFFCGKKKSEKNSF